MSTTKRQPPELLDFEKNRDRFADEQLIPYDKQWVAFSLDCTRIVAAAPDLEELDRSLTDRGEDAEKVWLEFIDLSPDNWPGGVDFG